MIKREDTLLHQIFEDLLFTHKDGLPEKTAIWHIPDPRQLLVSPTGTALADECQYSIDWTPDTKTSCDIQSITFSELNLTASHLAKQISKALRKFNDKNPADCVSASSDGPNDERHAQAHSVIAIFMPPGIDRIVTQIACMKLHLAYLPLDRQLSVGRVVQILELISPMMMICSKDYYDILLRSHLAEQTDHFTSYLNDKLDSMNYVINRIPVRIYESLMNTSPTFTDPGIVLCQDRLGTTTEHFFAHVRDPVVIVLFTSGSTTSDPKIVRLRNSQLVNRLNWQWASNVEMDGPGRWKRKHCLEDEYRQKREVILSSTACVFVDAFTELFSALFAGLTVVVPGGLKCASEVCVSDVRILYSLIRFFRITRLTTVPNQLTIWMNQMNLIESKECDADLSSLNTIVVSGDILLPELACTFFHLPLGRGTRLLNFYGTTEVAGDVTAYAFYSEQDVKRATKHIEGSTQEDTMVETSSFVAVGIPISNTTIYIVKRCGENICQRTLSMDLSKQSIIGDPVYPVDWSSMGYQVIEQGCVGEVAITGVPVGVFSDEKATAPASHPLTLDFQEANASRLTPAFLGNHAVYFPGDLGFISPEDHLLYVCGRSDELVKINAVRFLASEVDRLLLRIKENCTRKPSAMSWMEKKVINVYESVTLPVQHPSNGTKQLVCFYVVATDSSNLCGQVNFLSTEIKPVLHGSIKYHSHLTLLKPQSADWAKLSPKPNELSTTMANYLPVYIRPIFLAINRIPVMPTSGKVDKQRLRTLYEDTLTLERENHPPCKEAGGRLGADEVLRTLQKGEKRLKRPNYREQARRVLATILGVDPSVAQDRAGRPRDDEDFYLIGGNSLMAVLALESLRQLGFKVHLETFYQTSTIGRILDSLVPPGFAVLSTGNLLESQLMTESLLSKHIPLNTEEVCADLGYRLVKRTRMKAFATSEKVMIDPVYHEHNSYYMVRHLND
ncbi:unnamed protein product [Dicrocoelium dendriticum]|nr:unnamed protein product [Dicrocoelium dendriticum]CAH8565173.1 unnamed protein product [Dicrocoelium dendriticum]